jgi:hypothetical protein
MMLNGMQLRTLFRRFNGQYFGSRLPPYSIRVVRRSTWRGESGRCIEKRRVIEIQHGQPDEEAVSTLLHEMAHAANPKTKGYHTMPWKKEMIRLREAGAPLTSADLSVNLNDWDGRRVLREQFRTVVQDILMDVPNISLSNAIRLFISSQGGPSTITEFRRKFPWAEAVFNFEKSDRAEQEKRTAAALTLLKQRQAKTPSP